MHKVNWYSRKEEWWNVTTHAVGLVLSVFGLVLLLSRPGYAPISWFSFGVYGSSLVLLYAASTAYHSSRNSTWRYRLKILDHVAIFVLIAGSYTPFTLLLLDDPLGRRLFWITWGIALIGSILKIFFAGRFKLLSTLLYVGMGWIIVLVIEDLLEVYSWWGLFWLLAGGLAYSLGAVLYTIKRLPFNHAIFHIFVLLGSFCHFLSIYFHIPILQR